MSTTFSRNPLVDHDTIVYCEVPEVTYVGYVSTVEDVFTELRFRGDDGFEFEALILLPSIAVLPDIGSRHRIREKARHFAGLPTLYYCVLE